MKYRGAAGRAGVSHRSASGRECLTEPCGGRGDFSADRKVTEVQPKERREIRERGKLEQVPFKMFSIPLHVAAQGGLEPAGRSV